MVAPSQVCGWRDSGDESIRCDCPKYAARPGQSPNTAVRCWDCGHYKSWHDGSDMDTEIEPIVKDIMKKCQAEIGTLPKARAMKDEATNEALSGLKKDIERTKSVVLTRGCPVDKVERQINIRSVAMIVDGFNGDYWFQTEWSNKRIDEWCSNGWMLDMVSLKNQNDTGAFKSYRNRLKKDHAAPNGLDMEHVKGTAATRMRIPKQAYEMAWDISSINECLTTSGSDSESEYADNDKGKPDMKEKGTYSYRSWCMAADSETDSFCNSMCSKAIYRDQEKSGLDKEVRKKKKGKYIGSDEKSTKEPWSRELSLTDIGLAVKAFGVYININIHINFSINVNASDRHQAEARACY
ncbi:hypothetical protein JB92DRAFT_2834598 [Gautieria morchelliformis]|nr:hypothetical protein JB92DRAFT_2834598 [Gautieria morchelliformis]